MKKILLFLLVFISIKSYGQFPVSQSLGSPTTQVFSKGAFGADSGYVFRRNYVDTTAANGGFIKNIPNIFIVAADVLWKRNNAATKWERYLSLDYANTLYLYTSDNAITRTANNFQLGGTLLHDTYIAATSAYTLYLTGSRTGAVLDVGTTASSNGYAIKATADASNTSIFAQGVAGVNVSSQVTTGVGVLGSASTSGMGGWFYSQSGQGLQVSSVSGLPASIINYNGGSTNDVSPVLSMTRMTASTPANGLGGSIDLYLNTITTPFLTDISNRLIWKWTDATTATRTSEFDITGVNSATTETFANFQTGGIVRVNNLADTLATKAYARSVGGGGDGGETNTASNLGGGLANYSTKVGVDLRFNSFDAADFDLASNLISIDATKWLSLATAATTYKGIADSVNSTGFATQYDLKKSKDSVVALIPDITGKKDISDSTLSTGYSTNYDLKKSKDSVVALIVAEIGLAISDETTDITTGTAKITFRMPYAMTVTDVRANINTVSSSGLPTFDINESGSTILSTKITIDVSEKTSTTAATPAVISDTSLADDAEITIDIDTSGTGAKGAKIWIIGKRN